MLHMVAACCQYAAPLRVRILATYRESREEEEESLRGGSAGGVESELTSVAGEAGADSSSSLPYNDRLLRDVAPAKHTHTHTHTHTYTHTHARTHARARTHTRWHQRFSLAGKALAFLSLCVSPFLPRAHLKTQARAHARTRAHAHARTHRRVVSRPLGDSIMPRSPSLPPASAPKMPSPVPECRTRLPMDAGDGPHSNEPKSLLLPSTPLVGVITSSGSEEGVSGVSVEHV